MALAIATQRTIINSLILTFHILYYRLKQTDFDGNFTYSKTITIAVEQSDNLAINIFPNPAKENLQLTIGNLQKGKNEIEVAIYDLLGREVFKSTITYPKSEINLSSLSKGMYFLKANYGAKQTQIKFVKE